MSEAENKQPNNSRKQAAEDSQKRILEAARVAFAEHGFAGTSLESVANSAGCTKGLVAHYFGGKQKLWQAVVDYYSGMAKASEFVHADSNSDSTGVAEYLTRTFRFFQTHPDYTQIANQIVSDKSVAVPPEMLALLQDVSGAFTKAQDSGALRDDIDPRHAQLMSYSLISSWFTYRDLFQQAWGLSDGNQSEHDAAFLKDLLKLLERGLAPLPTDPSHSNTTGI